MVRYVVLFIIPLLSLIQVESAKQQVQLSDSYLPVAMQIISHITDQMAFETKEETTTKQPRPTKKPTAKPTVKPTAKPTAEPTSGPTSQPTSFWTTTSNPYVTNAWGSTTRRNDQTTPFHKPGLYAPFNPPKPVDRFKWNQHQYVLLPAHQNSQYTLLGPKQTISEGPLLSIHSETVKPLLERRPVSNPLLPPHKFVEIASRSERYGKEELTEENLQYLSEDVREMIKTAHNPLDNKVVDVFEGLRQGGQQTPTKNKLSATNLRLLLLYDLLSRDAKSQRLSDYSGFSPAVMKNLIESSETGARGQLKMALSKMVERNDCKHEYANNRAKEMVVELGKDESGMSAELRYLEPLIYTD